MLKKPTALKPRQTRYSLPQNQAATMVAGTHKQAKFTPLPCVKTLKFCAMLACFCATACAPLPPRYATAPEPAYTPPNLYAHIDPATMQALQHREQIRKEILSGNHIGDLSFYKSLGADLGYAVCERDMGRVAMCYDVIPAKLLAAWKKSQRTINLQDPELTYDSRTASSGGTQLAPNTQLPANQTVTTPTRESQPYHGERKIRIYGGVPGHEGWWEVFESVKLPTR